MEIGYEYLSLALEGTRFTAETTPDTMANVAGVMRWRKDYYEPNDSDGQLAQSRTEKVTRKWCEWQGQGPLDTAVLPYYLEMLVKGGITPSTPGGGTLSRLWDYVPTMDSDDVKLATIWWGDPNVLEMRAAGCFIQELRITNDATGNQGATMAVRGLGNYPAANSPTNPAQDIDPLIVPMNMALYIDTASAIGTTAITGRLIYAEHTIPSMIVPKFIPGGTASTLTYTDIGRGKRQGTNRAMTRIRLEVPDTTQFDQMDADTEVKLRVRHNGNLIEGSLYYYVDVDMYGVLRFADWGEHAGTNRTLDLQLYSKIDATLGADYRIGVQNTETAL